MHSNLESVFRIEYNGNEIKAITSILTPQALREGYGLMIPYGCLFYRIVRIN
jgi:hypothetical protein